jgi:hypothetical protein
MKPGCGKSYRPTGNRQKYCPEHSGRVQARLRATGRFHVGAGPDTFTTTTGTSVLERIQVDRRTPIAELLLGLAAVLDQGKGKVDWELRIGPVQ